MALLPIQPEGQSCFDIGRVLVLNDPPVRGGGTISTSTGPRRCWQALTLVHISAQPEPSLSLYQLTHPTRSAQVEPKSGGV